MSIVIAAIVLVGTLCVLNLLLTFGVLRRLREHSTTLAEFLNSSDTPRQLLDLVGKPLRMPSSDRPQLLGVFKAGCAQCVVQAQQFAKAGSGTTALAVVTGSGPDADALLDLLQAVPTLVEPQSSQLVKDLDVQFMPSFLRMDADGIVLAADITVEAVLQPSQV